MEARGLVNVQGRHKSAYGYRARIGLIVPPTNTVNEAEWARTMPDGVTFHSVRMPLHMDTTSVAGRKALVLDIAARVRELDEAQVDVVAYACTAGSMMNPRHALGSEIESLTGMPLVTTAAAIVDALKRFGARRISIATPYHDALNRHETEFLAGNGIESASIRGLGLGINGAADWPLIAETPVAAVEEHALRSLTDQSDALLITCTDLPTLPFLARLERTIGIPIVTSNQATLWAALRRCDIHDHIPSLGSLLLRS